MVWLRVAAVVSIPVYFAIEGLVRVLNAGRRRPLRPAERQLGAASLGDIDLEPVRMVDRARLPIAHRAITLGDAIYVKGVLDIGEPDDAELFVHELVHVRQRQERSRVGMAVDYGRGFADGFSYRDHDMEIEARAVASAVRSGWGSTGPLRHT